MIKFFLSMRRFSVFSFLCFLLSSQCAVADSYEDMYVNSSWLVVNSEGVAQFAVQIIKQGVAFENLAASLSTDPGSALRGGALGAARCTDYVAEVAKVLCSAELGKVVGPVRSQFGWSLHIVHARGKTLPDVELNLPKVLFKPFSPDLFLSCDMGAAGYPAVIIKGDSKQFMGTVNNMKAFMQRSEMQLLFFVSNGTKILIDRTTGLLTGWGSKEAPLLMTHGQCRASSQRLF